MASKNIIVRKKVGEELFDLYFKTLASQVESVYRSKTNDLGKVLESIATEIDAKVAQTDFDTLSGTVTGVKTKLDTLMAGDLDASLDTIKEIQDYLKTHEEAYEALLAIANGKVTAEEGKSLIADELITKITDLYTKADLDAKLEEMVNATTTAQTKANEAAASAAQNAKDIQTNKEAIATNAAGIKTNKEAIEKINETITANGKVILSSTVPADLTEADLLLFEVTA